MTRIQEYFLHQKPCNRAFEKSTLFSYVSFPLFSGTPTSETTLNIAPASLKEVAETLLAVDKVMGSKVHASFVSFQEILKKAKEKVPFSCTEGINTLGTLEKLTNIYLIRHTHNWSKFATLASLQERKRKGLFGLSLPECALAAEYASKSKQLEDYLIKRKDLIKELVGFLS